MFGNKVREFVISLPKQAKFKSEQVSLLLLKNGLSLSQYSFLLFLLIDGVFWEDCCLSLLTLGRPQLQCLHFEDSFASVFCFIAFVKIWDCSGSGRELLNFKGHNQDVFTCMFSPDDSNVVSCSADKTVKVLLQ